MIQAAPGLGHCVDSAGPRQAGNALGQRRVAVRRILQAIELVGKSAEVVYQPGMAPG
jgi:hypothetical protein